MANGHEAVLSRLPYDLVFMGLPDAGDGRLLSDQADPPT